MRRHNNRSRSRSRSRSPRKHKDRHERRDRSRDRDRQHRDSRPDRHNKRSRSRSRDRSDRRSKFDVDPSGRNQRGERVSKFSSAPPPETQNVYDPNAAKLEALNLKNAIVINPEAQNAQNELMSKQSELFGNLLENANFINRPEMRYETIRPTANAMDPFKMPFNKDGKAGLMNALTDTTKIKRKIYIPQDGNFNFTGLIIGPKGSNQKRLEEETGCKILVRGKGSQKEGAPPQPDDDEDLHVLIIAENEINLAKATVNIERILFADEETRVKIRQEQLRDINKTPYGPPSDDAFVIRVPKDCVGLVIGKSGETIRQLQMNSGAKKVQVEQEGKETNKSADYRNLFVEGDREAYEIVQQMVKDIIDQQRKVKQSMTGVLADNTQGLREEVAVPANLVGLIIGRGGETVKTINQRTGAVVFIPKEHEGNNPNERVLIVSGTPEQVQAAKMEINEKVQEGLRNQQVKALQAQGIPIELIQSLGLTDPMMLQQYLATFDPTYAAMNQHMYAQPVVTTVADASTLPGSQVNYQGAGYNQMMPNYGMAYGNMGVYPGQGMMQPMQGNMMMDPAMQQQYYQQQQQQQQQQFQQQQQQQNPVQGQQPN